MNFFERHPSQNWESIPFFDDPGYAFWAWFKPPHAPYGMVIQVPPEIYQQFPPHLLTIRKLMQSVGVAVEQVATWSLYGVTYASGPQAVGAADALLPPPPAGADPQIVVHLGVLPMMVPPVLTGVGDASLQASTVFDRLEAEWNLCLQLESKLVTLRKQLAEMMNRLNSLNRDLTPDERRFGTRQDKSDWEIARRWLRDLSTRLSKCIKEHDIGDASAAGKRKWIEEIHQTYVVPRRPFDALQQAEREFETHRKMLQSLLTSMNTAYTGAQQEGERRAQQVLGRIASAVRSGGRRR